MGTDAYCFGGQRICPNTQVRTDLMELAVWQEVGRLLEHPQRLEPEYRRRGHAPLAVGEEHAAKSKHMTLAHSA